MISLAAAALAVLTGCQSAVEKQRLELADSGDLSNCARIRVVSSGCGRNSGLTEIYVDNMHKNHAVRVTVRKHSQEGDDDTDYAIAEGGQLFVGCGGGGTSFAVVGCKVLKGEVEEHNKQQSASLHAQQPICSSERSRVRHVFTMHWSDSPWQYMTSSPSVRQ